MNACLNIENITLNEYLTLYDFTVSDFFEKSHFGTSDLIEMCLNFAKQNLLTEKQMQVEKENVVAIHKFHQALPQFMYLLVISATTKIPYMAASKILSLSSSFNRTTLLSAMHDKVKDSDWCKLFAENWSSCDGCTSNSGNFIEILNQVDLNEIRKNLSDEDIEYYNNLPDQVTIYRGTLDCDDINTGISWTTDLSIAKKFAEISESIAKREPASLRYIMGMGSDYQQILDSNPTGGVILKATVSKDKIIYTNNRGESEAIIGFAMDLDDYSVFETIGN